ncbi:MULTISPECIES: TetR/AcrR family transcriptional regulator [Streptomyces]|uniref:HTH tetR-type domain-containing protein n=2 Tax=Streptomyces TaxID=1883 RepID=A0A1D8FY85_9ACTN|nr:MULTISPECIES: TetR/AcrR family transcriptional regulator [Streptomyces]AOT58152.1 hypothetical protein A4G23_00956 [Streptomyces rubrolavendulae]OSY48795.1 hypothetical protein BG846_05619 [Streptomyces fradiae ATCC 10745 = DSM 40063]QEV11473.1 TetR/AcrR family transcriptional regulator [Streptomyces fradiae ATCC 10745 = DSM 40063]UQS28825.1 TetR/AcrR family transcriptional regulator [Streptomyces fradiae]
MAGRAAVPEVIWARPERTGRGPRPAYRRADIAAAAVRLADAHGVDAVSMRRVAAELGCGTMSLYNYVPRKEDLYELMVDEVSGEYELPEPTGDWRGDMLATARQTRAIMHRHPWLHRVMTTLYATGPNALRYLEACLGYLEPLDAPPGTKMECVGMVNGTVMIFVVNEFAMADRARAVPWTAEQETAVRGAYLGSQLATGRYPRLAALYATAPEAPEDPDVLFERAVSRVLDGFG